MGFPGGWFIGEESACLAGDMGLIPGSVRKIPWRRKWQPTPVFLPGESQGQKSLAGHSSWIAESDTTEVPEHSTAHSSSIGDEKWSGFIRR